MNNQSFALKQNDSTIEIQLKTLLNSGVSLEDACDQLELDRDAAELYIKGGMEQNKSVDDLIKEFKPICLKALIEIGLDRGIENISARVTALKTVVEGEGEFPAMPVDKLSAMYKKMKGVVESYSSKKTQSNGDEGSNGNKTTKLNLAFEPSVVGNN